jgi:hypothetical protein
LVKDRFPGELVVFQDSQPEKLKAILRIILMTAKKAIRFLCTKIRKVRKGWLHKLASIGSININYTHYSIEYR